MARSIRVSTVSLIGAAALLLPGCGKAPEAAPPLAEPAQAAQPIQPAPPTPPVVLATLEDVCAALLPDASFDELRAIFGDGLEMDEESNAYIYPGTPRELTPVFRDNFPGALDHVATFAYSDQPSAWTLRGLKVGDTADALTRANGKPFKEGGESIDWDGGALADKRCLYSVTLDPDIDDAGNPVPGSLRKIQAFSLRWRRDLPAAAPATPAPLPPIVPAATRQPFEPVCAKLREDMSPDDITKLFGAENVRPTGHDDTWTVFPDDPRRAFDVIFRHWAEDGADVESWGIYSISINNPASTWALPNGLGMGDRPDAVERASGGPFEVARQTNSYASGPAWDHDKSGKGPACSYHLTFSHDRALLDARSLMSNDATFLSWRPYVSSIRVDWRWF